MEKEMLVIAVLGLILTLISITGAFIWKLTRVESSLRENINEAKNEIESKQDNIVHDFGETIAAIRQKVSDVELFGAQNYVRRDGFYKVQEQLTADIRTLGDKMDARFQRLEVKIDTKT